jgi:hypothetical protein
VHLLPLELDTVVEEAAVVVAEESAAAAVAAAAMAPASAISPVNPSCRNKRREN